MSTVLAQNPADLVKDRNEKALNTAIGNFMADATFEIVNPLYKKRTGKDIDFVMLNWGGIRSDLPKGDVTVGSVYDIMPFENKVVVLTMSGEKVQELLNYLIKERKPHPLSKQIDLQITKDGKVVYEGIINNSSWKLFGVASSDNLKILQKNLTKNILILSCILIILSLFIGIIASKILSEPITRLKIAMIDMDKKWTHIKISTDIAEVSELENEYNRLIDRIKALTENITKEEKARRVFELKMLQSQINPHFLYNTLDTILWLSELNENESVIKVTSALGKLLRFSLSTDLDFVSIKDEIEHVKNYLEIQKIRYEDMLVYEIDSIDNLKDAFIPKLIIQPIVENAIYHGLRPNGGGKINISFESFDNDIIIIVSDNGKGFDTEKLKEDSPSDNKIYLGGIGIKNVDHRIKLLCGDNYGISIKSAPGMGTKVVIKLREKSL